MRTIATIAVVAGSLIGSSTALAAPQDLAAGAGKFPNGTHFGFSAHGVPGDAKGNAFFELGPAGKVHADVDCLNVQGNKAAVSGFLKQPVLGTSRYILLIEDGGSPSKNNPTPDRGYFILEYLAPPADCGFYNFLSVPNGTPIVQGNWEIKDRE